MTTTPTKGKKAETQSATLRLSGPNAQRFAKVREDMLSRLPALSEPSLSDVLAHALYLADDSLAAKQ